MSPSKLLSLVAILLVSSASHAMILFEPYVGYGLGNYKFTDATSLETSTGKIDGFAYGAKLGLEYSGGFIGGEYQGFRSDKKEEGQNDSVSWSSSTVFGVVGFQMPIGLRISYGYSVMPSKSIESTEPDRTEYSGKAQKISVGYRYKFPLALNVDYIQYKFDKFKQGTTNVNIKDKYSKSDDSTVLVSVSFPFDL